MGDGKKRSRDDTAPFRRKKSKVIHSSSVLEDSIVAENNNGYSDTLAAELLNSENIREGMLLLGCVTRVKPTFFEMSLPGNLFGTVPMTNISERFLYNLRTFAIHLEREPCIQLIIEVGMVFPCKVIEITGGQHKRKSDIILSIDPKIVNSDLKPASLYSKMVLFVTVCSVEDHGYAVDVGPDCIQGFVALEAAVHRDDELEIGAVIPTFIKHIDFSLNKTSAKLQLSLLDFNQDFPEISIEDIKLPSILPGAKIRADVIDVRHPFIYMKYLCFDACASVLSLGSTYKAISIGSTIIGTVLYVHPVTHLIYVMLNMKPSPHIFPNYFGLRKHDHVYNLKFQYVHKSRAYYKINKGTYGYIHVKDLPQNTVNQTVSKAVILKLHYMDNLVQMSAKPSVTERIRILKEDVQVGDVYDGKVKVHHPYGMVVEICPGLSGFVRTAFMSDVYVTDPENLFPVGSKVKCRVMDKNEEGNLQLTTKESLVNLLDRFIPISYGSIQKGQYYKGVIVKKAEEYFLVVFFNGVTGIVSMSHVPARSVYFEGQTVLCEVLSCNPTQKKLKISLKTDDWCSIEEIDDLWDTQSDTFFNAKPKVTGNEKSSSLKLPENDIRKESKTKMSKMRSDPSGESSQNMSIQKYGAEKSVQAEIISVKGCQLNILFNKTKGRVHITELGCSSEDVYPLREFSVGERIQVFIIGEHVTKKRNFLKITHKDNLESFKECSLQYPPASVIQDLNPGSSLIGFVKKVTDVCVILWLTPTQVGILNYLHFSENTKVLRKAQQSLKIGLSLEVTVLNNKAHPKKHDGRCITLTKIEKNLPEVGKNVIGLVQAACIVKGLVLKLPFDYHGSVAVTDFTDLYIPIQTLIDKCHKMKFLLCHVLEVNHETKYCQVSLRKSRIYGHKISLPNVCPEILYESLKEGEYVKGFVKSISHSAVTVVLGRNLEGKIEIHNCKSTDCSLCNATKDTIAKYPVGSVVEVFIQKKSVNARSSILVLKDSKTLKNDNHERLILKGDISWDED